MAQLKTRIRCSSLFETMVAMTIAVVIFGIALMVYLNVTGSSGLRQKVKADMLLQEWHQETVGQKAWFDAEQEVEGINLSRHVKAYQGHTDLLLLELEAVDTRNRRIAHIRSIVMNNE